MLAVPEFLKGYLAEALLCPSCSINTEQGKALLTQTWQRSLRRPLRHVALKAPGDRESPAFCCPASAFAGKAGFLGAPTHCPHPGGGGSSSGQGRL